jgi:hypothetical protein
MKKIIGIAGVIIALVFSLNTNTLVDSSESNIDLTSLLALNTANAEDPEHPKKMPTPVLCPNGAEYKTDCVGYSANGCNTVKCTFTW